MFKTVLVANRGEIAVRIIRTLKRLGIVAVAVYSEGDAGSLHVHEADVAVCCGPAPALESYLRVDKILAIAQEVGAEAIHPGYGFLAENADFAQACADRGIVFIGPRPEHIRDFGLKHKARELAVASQVPLLPGSGLLAHREAAHEAALAIGYPVMLKSTAGGGGIGMRLCHSADTLDAQWDAVLRLARAHYHDAGIYLERYVAHARHIEVQIFGDGLGHAVSLGERDCSLQRRHQKVIEETPAPGLSLEERSALSATAVRLVQSVSYASAGTVEFVYDTDAKAFFFLEVNTRLQVEHGVTEAVTGIDLVEWMVRLAAGEQPSHSYRHSPSGHAIEARLYAEDPARGFLPASGTIASLEWPRDGARIETWVVAGSDVTPHYDPLLAKLIVHGTDRAAAVAALGQALNGTQLAGLETNLDYLARIAADPAFQRGGQTTSYLASVAYKPLAVEILEPGLQTTVQDWPGRVGFWQVGVPPSGPMDVQAFRLGNWLVGNDTGASALELTMTGPKLRFSGPAIIALTGAPFSARIGDRVLPMWQALYVEAGTEIHCGTVKGAGMRAYLAIQGGWQVAPYLGSRATFTLGQFGGHEGRSLKAGDRIRIEPVRDVSVVGRHLARARRPRYSRQWSIAVLYGPHGAPDFFTPDDMRIFFAARWQVHHQSNRTGVRLVGPKPRWARSDGGEAGLHPSNIHDNAYAIGSIDFTGDMPVILGPDGPSLGGFVCPAVVVLADLWKLGQLRPGDTLRFRRVTLDQATEKNRVQEAFLKMPVVPPHPKVSTKVDLRAVPLDADSAIIGRVPEILHGVEVVYRSAGDAAVLVEYGAAILDLGLRMRAHALMQWIEGRRDTDFVGAVIDLTPGIRSLQVHYDPRRLDQGSLVAILQHAEAQMGALADCVVPSRIVHLPLAWDDSQTQLAIARYQQSVRKDAPWCPRNIEFIRRINGLDSEEAVRRIVFDASYMVLGLGDVYLGAPVATPIDPRHRLVTTKYNPARTWTPENAVGIGGAYMCIYGMESPGGYQFVGRTLQVWSRYRRIPTFADGTPWLLRFFDQIRFYPVTEAELMLMRRDFPLGRMPLRIEETQFSLKDYREFLIREHDSIQTFKDCQQAAFVRERESWAQALEGVPQSPAPSVLVAPLDGGDLDSGAGLADPATVIAPVAGSVWKIEVAEGDRVNKGDVLLILESMKMEVVITAPRAGRVKTLSVSAGASVDAGEDLVWLYDDDKADGEGPQGLRAVPQPA